MVDDISPIDGLQWRHEKFELKFLDKIFTHCK